MEPLDNHLASPVKGAAKQMTSDHSVVSPAEIGVEMEVGLSVFLGDVTDKAGDLHLLLESLIDIFLGGWIKETQGSGIHGPDASDLTRQDILLLTKSRQGGEYFLMVVYADDISVAILDE